MRRPARISMIDVLWYVLGYGSLTAACWFFIVTLTDTLI